MAQKLQQQLKELGSKLENPPTAKDALLKLLKNGAAVLSELDQSPSASVLESMQPFLKAVVKPELLRHQDKDVKLLVASCLCEITRITAPEAPYSDDIMKDIFGLIVGTFSGLNDTNGPSFGRRVIILEMLARYRSYVMMLDLECDDLVSEMVRTFIDVVRDDHPESVLTSMKTIIVVLLEESEDIHEDLLHILLTALGRNTKGISKAARKLVMNVMEHCATKLEPAVKQFLISSMSGDSRSSKSQIDYHEVIYDLYCCSPQILSGVIPYLTGELLIDHSENRLKAVKLVGELFALPGAVISEEFEPIFSEFLKRLTDRVVEVRMTVLEYIKNCLLSSPSRPEAPQIFAALCDRLLDYDENVRRQVVGVVCDVARFDLDSVPIETAKLVAERLRDKSLLVKKYTLDRLAEVYCLYCLRIAEGCPNDYDWIPGKILRCFYDKDFRSDSIESVLCGSLFPYEFTIKDLVNQWIRIFSGLDKVEVKALEKIMEQKQRLQQEMQKYLSHKQTYKDSDVPDFQRKVGLCFRLMSRCFTDPAKAEEGFQALDQLKDANIWKILLSLLDPNTSFSQARGSRDDLLKILGEKHRLFDFMSILAIKCSYMLFSKEHVKEILSQANSQKSAGAAEHILSCMNMLVILARYSPLLLIGSEEDLLHLLKDENEIIKEGILHVLARAGGTIRGQLASSSCSVDLMLERLCLEGSRRQAKYAVHALAAITKDDGLLSLSVLYKRLVDMLEEGAHLPAVLQSLGCIAQTTMAVFETRESEIVEYIKNKILERHSKAANKKKARWRDRSELCLLKIFGIKTLVKSYLPVKDAHLRDGIDNLIEVLRNMLCFGEISKEIESSSVDRAHLRLASAKAILRLSRYWDHKIPADVFHLTLRTVEITYPQARKLFLDKVHQYVKDRVLDAKYACAFLVDIVGQRHATLDEDKHNLADIIQMCRQLRMRQLSLQCDTTPCMPYPEYILPYLVHVLAHHPECPNVDECKDVKAFESIYRLLHLFLSMVVHGEEDAKPEVNTTAKEKESVSAIISIFQCIKLSEDVANAVKSKNSHAICDLGLSIIKRLGQKLDGHQDPPASVSLPSMLYKLCERKEENDAEVCAGQTWLADDSVLAHFESLELEVNGMVRPEIAEDEILEDSERDGNEMSLGKLIKYIKSQKNKAKNVVKSDSSLSEAKHVRHDVDILNVVREINLDSMEVSGKFDSSNGHDNLLSSKRNDGDNNKKKRKASDSTSISVPKRQRSISARSPSKLSFPRSPVKNPIHTTLANKLSMQGDNDPRPNETDLFVSCIRKKRTDKGSDRGNDEGQHKVEGADLSDQKGSKSLVGTEKIIISSNAKSVVGSIKKRKRRSIAGLAKCTSKAGNHAKDLVDCRIKVWWPLDKKFYEGVVKSYDPEKKKHVLLYDDGDVEVLRLEKERWELIDDAHSSKMRPTTSRSPHKGTPPDNKNEFSNGSRQKRSDKRSNNKRKVAERKNSVLRKDVSGGKTTFPSEEAENRSSPSNCEVKTIKVDKSDSGNLKGEQANDAEKSMPCHEEQGSDPEGRNTETRDESPSDLEESEKEVKPSRESGQIGGMEGRTQDYHGLDMSISLSQVTKTKVSHKQSNEGVKPDDAGIKTSEPNKTDFLECGDAEDADDKPLSTWKRRSGKSRGGK
ncbi:hypothetical protein Nepgr_007065 [Nepenthes gracilis]|uniref:Sister chromatid cohesion protein PDS5 homolog A n=1 Tax=Nepenthes gracilis TaxID=150966 RepID=A0AAD3S6I3_NEPGR|nr:hypothetical protein Nepgr_007065 [Nepenthes gracilis]